MRILGAIIAGGQARRFGSDKASAEIAGRAMIDHVIAALAPQVEQVVICGRTWPGLDSLEDRREGRIGPLAGLESALLHAGEGRFGGVLSVPVDTLPLPPDLVALLAGARPRIFRHQHLIGYWPTPYGQALRDHIDDGGRSLGSWIARCRATFVEEPFAMINVNARHDLESLPRDLRHHEGDTRER
jgi:molybdopterin-guanine dinucleotide biosynthesis protein A